VEISKKLEITIAIPKNVGSIQKVEVLINRYGESPSIIQKMKITKEDNDFITYSTFCPIWYFKIVLNNKYNPIW